MTGRECEILWVWTTGCLAVSLTVQLAGFMNDSVTLNVWLADRRTEWVNKLLASGQTDCGLLCVWWGFLADWMNCYWLLICLLLVFGSKGLHTLGGFFCAINSHIGIFFRTFVFVVNAFTQNTINTGHKSSVLSIFRNRTANFLTPFNPDKGSADQIHSSHSYLSQ